MPKPTSPPPTSALTPLAALNRRIIACERCERLREHCKRIARQKRASYRNQTYWGRPIPNLYDEQAPPGSVLPRILIVGLAPAAHGANRTGRMFTGDRSGDFLFAAMHAVGLCNQPTATDINDGLRLHDVLITAAAHCAPPDNKPTPGELANCREYLEQTFDALPNLRVVVCLGQIGHLAALRFYKSRGWVRTLSAHRFAHGALHRFEECVSANGEKVTPPPLLDTYHPSQQNTFRGRLTQPMLREVFAKAKAVRDGQ